MYVNVITNYVEAIIKCRYRLAYMLILLLINKGNNKITELRTILQRESKNS